MAIINDGTGGAGAAKVDNNGSVQTGLFDSNGNPIFKLKNGVYAATDRLLPIGGLNDGIYRPARVGRYGGLSLDRFMPLTSLNLFTAALPPHWLNPVTTMTATIALGSGILLNAGASLAASGNASLISMVAATKYQKSPLHSRHRARLIKGGANAIAELGLGSTQAPGSAVLPAGAVFLYGSDGSLKPTLYGNSGSILGQGTDISGLINSANYYVWDVILDDDNCTFIVQDATAGTIINEQVLNITSGVARQLAQLFLFSHARCYQTATAATSPATQLFVGDATLIMLDTDTNKPWGHQRAGDGMGSVVNPTLALTQLENYANSAAPVSATLSNTAAGYTTLGGQFQFATVAGAETDYALFGFQVPTGVKLNVTGIMIDSLNTGAAVATTATWLQWFAGVDGTAVTLAANNFRKSLGNQVFAIGAAIGAQAPILNHDFGDAPLVTNSGRFFHVGLKMPLGTATASQIIRGNVQVRGYFD